MNSLSILVFIALFPFLTFSTVYAADSYIVGAGSTETIDEHGVCKEVTNSGPLGIMVPTKTDSEWHTGGASFLENPYAGISALDCGPPCGGASVGSYCWYAGASSASCTNTCSAEGLVVDMDGTRDFAGSGGTNANCVSVLNAIGLPSGSMTSNPFAGGNGCFSALGKGTRATATTTAGAVGFSYKRACACK